MEKSSSSVLAIATNKLIKFVTHTSARGLAYFRELDLGGDFQGNIRFICDINGELVGAAYGKNILVYRYNDGVLHSALEHPGVILFLAANKSCLVSACEKAMMQVWKNGGDCALVCSID